MFRVKSGLQEYIAFLKYCLGESLQLPDNTKNIDWKDLLIWAERQAIVGIVFCGIEKARGLISIPREKLFQWIGYVQQVEQQNRLVNKRCVELVEELINAGFECCILKGQGNATLYDVRGKKEDGRSLALLRTSGDIDIWVYAKEGGRCKREELVDYVRRKHPEAEVRYYHIGYMDDGVPVEVHFMPGIMNNPVYNKRLQVFYRKMAEGGCLMAELPNGVGSIPVPTWEFNIVFQLAHMMHHFFDEGIGLRQMIDYYYLLMHNSQCIMHNWECTLRYLNLYNFAGAVMYIMKEVLGLEDKYLIVPVDERRGKTLLKEILKGGNFGRADVRWKKAEGRWHTGKKYFLKGWRNLQFVKEYPAEALCEPVFRTWHYFWRLEIL